MTQEQWQEVFQIYERLQDQPDDNIEEFLAVSGLPPSILIEIRSLLGMGEEEETPRVGPGDTFHQFEIREPIGAGSTGAVFSAWDTQLARPVAVKFLALPSFLLDGNATHGSGTFLREARAASAINHPSIVTVYSVLQVDPSSARSPLAIVMELIEGVSLRELCGTALPPKQALEIVHQIASALAAVHARGIVHGDIKPENVMVRPDQLVKVVDFGLAHQLASELNQGTAGKRGGTFRYMAPEQYHGRPAAPESDVFSLGVVLYELTAGRTPFAGLPPEQAADALANRSPNFAVVPASIRPLVKSMLALAPESRPAATGVVARIAVRQAVLSRRRTAAAAVVLLAVLIGAALLWRGAATRRAQRAAEPLLEQITKKRMENRVTAAALSADGSTIVYATTDGGAFLRDNQTGRTHEIQLPPGLRAYSIVFSPRPGGGLLVAGATGETTATEAWKLDPGGAPPVRVWTGVNGMCFSQDGANVAFVTTGHREIWVRPADSSGPGKRVFAAGPGETVPLAFWSARKDSLLFRRHRPCAEGDPELNAAVQDDRQCGDDTIQSLDLRTGRLTLRARNLSIYSAAMLRDGSLYFLKPDTPQNLYSFNLWRIRTNPQTGEWGQPNQLSHINGASLFQLSTSADGLRATVVRSSTRPNFSIANLGGPKGLTLQPPLSLTLELAANFPHAWTADSRWVIFESDRGGSHDLYRQAPGQREAETLTAEKGDEVMAQASPDGRWVLYVWYPVSIFQRAVYTPKLKRVPVSGGAVPHEVPISGALDEFRCSIPGYGTRCVLRVTSGDQQFYYDLDPVRGQGVELGRSRILSKVLGAWALSADGTRAAIPDVGRPGEYVELVLNADPALRSETRFKVAGIGPINGMNPFAGKQGWLISPREEAVRPATPGMLEVQTRTESLFYIDEHQQSTLMYTTPLHAYGVVSPDGKQLAYLNSEISSDVWIFRLPEQSQQWGNRDGAQ